ncbi:MAG: hypothetical protein FHP92_07100 [Denitromonas halophila]|nr:MAG: hypothetical protein FHP94_18220 [Denitromonas halophila]TVT71858.1 MAG: hypothetical protein FHP93_08640 [Denitromonas halophila]TVT77011.1 MAG: hypothetical protein FHP92_07100 [Denitromonas halophila]
MKNSPVLMMWLTLLCASVQAADMDAFFANAKNEKGFAASTAAGQVVAGRQRIMAACAEAKTKNPAADCACVERELGQVSDRTFYYESVLAYQAYREKVEALEADDQARYAQLKQQHARRLSLSRRLETACGKF